MSETPFQAILPLWEGRPWARSRGALKVPLLTADALVFILLFTISVASTLFVNKKASFPKNPKDYWSSKTIDSILERGPSLLDAKSEDIQGLIDLGIACYQKGPDSYVEGLKALERARYLGAMDKRIFWYAARMYEEKGLAHFALEDYERYLRFSSSDTLTQLRAASLFYKEGDAARALKHYQVVLAAWPGNPTALYDVACIYSQEGDYAKAQPLLEKCLSVMGGDLPPRGHFMLGQSYELKGLLQKALAEYQKEFLKNKSDANLLKALAGTYERTQQDLEAQKIWVLAYQISPRDPLVRSKYQRALHLARERAKKNKTR